MLQSPGANTATIGSVLMILIHCSLFMLFMGGAKEWVASVYYEWGGLSAEGLVKGRVWQLLTHSWLHVNWWHLSINVVLFYYACARLSHFLSNWRIFGLFVICGVGSGLAHVLSQLAFPGLFGLVGASGGLTGLLMGFFSISPDSRMALLNISAGNLSKGVLIASALLFVMNPALNLPFLADFGKWLEGAFGEMIFQSAHLVHFTGGLMGWVLISRFLPRLLSQSDLARMRQKLEERNSMKLGHDLTATKSSD